MPASGGPAAGKRLPGRDRIITGSCLKSIAARNGRASGAIGAGRGVRALVYRLLMVLDRWLRLFALMRTG
ncbi:hypothetical protein UF16_14810 [Chromobacterium violaceum]|nr:hypothetical protein UF16_14810 [Chromobacterium violaceum]